MKKSNHFKKSLFQVTLITATLFCVSSCNTTKKPEDTKDIAEVKNEEKFENTNKEKDGLFLVNASEINLKEIQLGQLAQERSKTISIKELGKMMEESHRKSQNDLIALATKKSITIPTSLTDNARDAYKKLTDISDADFDKEYSDMMVIGHKDAISKFDKASTDSKDADIKAWAATTLPILHSHLDCAINCQKTCEVNDKSKK